MSTSKTLMGECGGVHVGGVCVRHRLQGVGVLCFLVGTLGSPEQCS